jgi:hypothetical protein
MCVTVRNCTAQTQSSCSHTPSTNASVFKVLNRKTHQEVEPCMSSFIVLISSAHKKPQYCHLELHQLMSCFIRLYGALDGEVNGTTKIDQVRLCLVVDGLCARLLAFFLLFFLCKKYINTSWTILSNVSMKAAPLLPVGAGFLSCLLSSHACRFPLFVHVFLQT